MTRSLIFAISAFSLLILINIGVFGYLIFNDLSETWANEQVMQGLHEAEELIRQQDPPPFFFPGQEAALSRQVAPRLRQYRVLRAILVLDRHGRVLHREVIRSTVVVPSPKQMSEQDSLTTSPFMMPVNATAQDHLNGPRFALEYDPGRIEQEVQELRRELNRKLALAIALSLILLSLGLTYVIWAYRRNQSLQNRAAQADRMAYLGTLSSGLAHEIRNPLNSMNMNVQLIQEELQERGDPANEDLSDMLDGTRNEIMRLERLVSSFLAFARPTELQTHPCQINDLLDETLIFLEPEILKRGVVLETQFANDLPEISADEQQLRQAFINLLLNAIQVLRPKKRVAVTTRKRNNGGVSVQIRDEGPGISPEELNNIFKVFYSTRVGGTGLGLPIVQRIVQLHQGNIKVESEMGKGTTFSLFFPARAQAG